MMLQNSLIPSGKRINLTLLTNLFPEHIASKSLPPIHVKLRAKYKSDSELNWTTMMHLPTEPENAYII